MLELRPGTAHATFSRGGQAVLPVPAGGRLVLVTAAGPTPLASRVARQVTRYQAPGGREFWIETSADDAALLHRALLASATPGVAAPGSVGSVAEGQAQAEGEDDGAGDPVQQPAGGGAGEPGAERPGEADQHG